MVERAEKDQAGDAVEAGEAGLSHSVNTLLATLMP
jgi:hypothetical protein